MKFHFSNARFQIVPNIVTGIVTGAAIAAAGFTPEPAVAQGASLGCWVLLCAASVNPSWIGVPACVPKMEQLFDMLARGDPWPPCPEGGEVGGLNYQPYLPCPDDTIAGNMINNGRGGGGEEWEPNANGDLCGRTTVVNGGFRDNGPTQTVTTTARPVRIRPYNVQISVPGRTPFTFWFGLKS